MLYIVCGIKPIFLIMTDYITELTFLKNPSSFKLIQTDSLSLKLHFTSIFLDMVQK